MIRSSVRMLIVPWVALRLVPSSPCLGDEPVPVPTSKVLTLSPQTAPRPLLRYRLLPLDSERTPGDAVPIYLRVMGEISEESERQIDAAAAWLEKPVDDFPFVEASNLAGQWQIRLQQIEFGARRSSANWNYTLPEQREDAINVLLPDVGSLRRWARLLTLKARVEVLGGEFAPASRSIETGLAFSRHMAEGPFLINGLVAIAVANGIVDRIEEFVSQKDAPNLYWALTELPRPLVDLRRGLATEIKIGEWVLPELADFERSRSSAEWSATLARLHARMNPLAKELAEGEADVKTQGLVAADLGKFREENLAAARAFLEKQPQVAEMSDDEILVRYIGARFRELRDRRFAPMFLPYRQAAPLIADVERDQAANPDDLAKLFGSLTPFLIKSFGAQAKLDRRVAALRTIEALRMHAAANGDLPASLADVRIVPIPEDPITGEPFGYRKDGDRVELTAPAVAPSLEALSYTLSLKK